MLELSCVPPQAEISARAQSARFVTSGYEPRRRGFVAASPAEDEDEDDRPHGYVPGMGTAPSGFRFPGPRYRRGEPQVQQAAEAEPSGQGSVQEGMSAAREGERATDGWPASRASSLLHRGASLPCSQWSSRRASGRRSGETSRRGRSLHW